MEYEICRIDQKQRLHCCLSCKASEVDETLLKLAKKYPDNKWIFGIDLHFREVRDNKMSINWS